MPIECGGELPCSDYGCDNEGDGDLYGSPGVPNDICVGSCDDDFFACCKNGKCIGDSVGSTFLGLMSPVVCRYIYGGVPVLAGDPAFPPCGQVDCCDYIEHEGACCRQTGEIDEGTCTFELYSECVETGGVFMGPGTNCPGEGAGVREVNCCFDQTTTEPPFVSGEGNRQCPADINGDGFVDVNDVLELISSWGDPGGPADINGDGIVDVNDMLELINSWGPCSTSTQKEYRIVASDASANDYFGMSVYISGNIAVVGAPVDNPHGFGSGSAYVFRFNGTNWIEEQKITASDGAVADIFGRSVSISDSGNVIAIGASGVGIPSMGALYIYQYDPNWKYPWLKWVEAHKIDPPGNHDYQSDYHGDNMGMSVDFDGDDTIIIGAPGHIHGAYVAKQGHVYIFNYNGIEWEDVATLKVYPNMPESNFGMSVDISGNHAIVGTYPEMNVNLPGKVWIFRRESNGIWNPVPVANLHDLVNNDDLGGNSVSISDKTVVVGSPQGLCPDANGNCGKAFVFRENMAGSWDLVQELFSREPEPEGMQFGKNVSILDDTIVVGADQTNIPHGPYYPVDNVGSAEVYNYDSINHVWVETDRLNLRTPVKLSQFGASVNQDLNNSIIVGAPGDNSNSSPSSQATKGGSATIFMNNTPRKNLPVRDDLISWQIALEKAKEVSSEASDIILREIEKRKEHINITPVVSSREVNMQVRVDGSCIWMFCDPNNCPYPKCE